MWNAEVSFGISHYIESKSSSKPHSIYNFNVSGFSKKKIKVDESEMDEGEKEILGQTPLPRDGRVPDAKY